MTCNACGEKPKKTCNDFTKAVIEINNPETLVLLRKVVIPASMGTEEQVPAAIGKYHNVILKYEANKHIYLYSSDGIPTLLEMDVPQEVWDSIDELQEEIDEIKNNPDVVDIVDTYADLESYDTSKLGDNDVIRVLNDETHDGESTYYRWNLSSQTWTFIGGLGPYYTKDETDALIDAAKGSAKELTSEDYNWPTANPDGIALWKLPTGMYVVPTGVNTYYDSGSSGVSVGPRVIFVNSDLVGSNCAIFVLGPSVSVLAVNEDTGNLVLDTHTLLASQVVDVLTSTATKAPLSANQGRVLKDMIDNNVGMARVLTADDYNWNSTSSSATAPYDSIALWLLPSGQYHIDDNSMKVFTSITATEIAFPDQHMYLINKEPTANASILVTPYSAATPQTRITLYVTSVASGQPSGGTTVNGMTIPWGDIPTVVQTTGSSTTNVMSQKAVSDAINNIPEYVVNLTTDDYDFPDSSPNSVAIWRLPDGIYYAPSPVEAARDIYSSTISSAFFIVSHDAVDGAASILTVLYNSVEYSYAAANGNPTTNPSRLLNSSNISNGLNAVAAGSVLDARQGKVLKDMIDNLPSAPTVVQTTGQSTTDVMSQKAVTDALATAGGGLTTLSYGNSTWNDFLTAYNAGKIVYCRASSNADPSSGSQTRMAFMAYINNPTAPTEVEFQYVRSVSSKTASQQMDQVYVYKLTSASGGTWTVATRDMASKIVAGTNMTSSYSNGTLTLNATAQAQQQADWSQADTTAVDFIKNKPTIPTVNDATLTIQKNGTNVATFTANASTNTTANIVTPEITLTTTDPGEGAPLAANNFIGVYQ